MPQRGTYRDSGLCRPPGRFLRYTCVFLLWEQVFAGTASLARNSAKGFLSRLHLAKKLFANEEHSYAKTISGYVLVMPLAGTNLLAIPVRVALYDHSGTVSVAELELVLCQPLLHLFYDNGL